MGKKIFKTKAELDGYLKNKVEDAMDEVYETLLDKLLNIIDKDVYQAYTPEFYDRTYDLRKRENWYVKRYARNGVVYRNLYFKEENLTEPHSSFSFSDPHSFIHGNPYEVFQPNAFLKMLNREIQQGDGFNFHYVERNPFWDDFMDYCDKYYNRLFKNACKRNGISIE